MQAVLARRAPAGARPEEELVYAVRQIILRGVALQEVVDIFSVAGLKRFDILILSDALLTEVCGLPRCNLAVELLQKRPKG